MMVQTLYKICLLSFFTFLSEGLIANVAQPGIWNAGYSGRFTLLFAEDTASFGKIQMQDETVLVDLYATFAAVKGEYQMYNTTDKPITITVGYPVNGEYSQEPIGSVMYDDLYNLKAFVNSVPVNTLKTKDTIATNNEWYSWKTTFAPNSLTKLTVYFLTDNSKAQLRKGYNTEKGNAFTYVLESGRAWAGIIDSGKILMRLNDGLTLKNIRGILPDSIFRGDDTHLEYRFTNLEPSVHDNVLLWYDAYDKKTAKVKTEAIDAEKYFTRLDNFPIKSFEQPGFKLISKQNFEVHDTISGVFWTMFAGAAILVVAVLLSVIYLVMRFVKNKK